MATGGVSTLIACGGDITPALFQSARRAGFDGEILVLFDGTGKELGRLRRPPN